jgi:hypothetical protein
MKNPRTIAMPGVLGYSRKERKLKLQRERPDDEFASCEVSTELLKMINANLRQFENTIFRVS